MTLSFTLEDGLFVAEFEAISRFNLHLERPASGSIYMKQKTVKDGSYVIVKDFGWNRDGDLIIDADCGQGAVYPKWIRLESAVEPSVAEVTFESESSGGGAGSIDGEYFLAKAQDFYWKPALELSSKMTYDMPEYQSYKAIPNLFTQVGSAFEGVSFDGQRMPYRSVLAHLVIHYDRMNRDESVSNPIIAVRESNIDNIQFGKFDNLVSLYKSTLAAQGQTLTDDEVLAMLEEIGLRRITKEEYESLLQDNNLEA